MFTGIVQGTAEVLAIEDHHGLRSLTVGFPGGALAGVEKGASIALDGVCLTVVAFQGDTAHFDVIDETVRLTTLGARRVGARLNYERAATFGTEIGGHVLSGHIIGTAEVTHRAEVEGNLELVLRPPADTMRFLMAKGFVAVDGISLTLGRVEEHSFSLHIIPETRAVTTLDERGVGASMNLELDAMTQAVVTTVERVLAARGG